MGKLNHAVDVFFIDGCGRCELGGTPNCKVHKWTKELEQLRFILLDTVLVEERKWGVPCYTFNRKNIILLSALKDYVCISFLKGSLINDKHNILEKAGENSNVARLIKFTNIDQVFQTEKAIKEYIIEAINNEKQGLKVEATKINIEDFPIELLEEFENDAIFKNAFLELTQGKQRSYLMHYNQAKQIKTRIDRIQKSKTKVFQGKGFNEY